MKLFKYFIFSLLLLTLASCGNNENGTVNVTDYIDMKFKGYDGYGTADFEINDQFHFDTYYNDDEIDHERGSIIFNELSSMEFTLDNDKNLSNGDKVTMTVTMEDFIENLTADSPLEFNVEGLEPLTELTANDLKENVTVTFSGIDTAGRVGLIELSDDLPQLVFTTDFTKDLTNGETITLKVINPSLETLHLSGYLITEEESSFDVVVEGLE